MERQEDKNGIIIAKELKLEGLYIRRACGKISKGNHHICGEIRLQKEKKQSECEMF